MNAHKELNIQIMDARQAPPRIDTLGLDAALILNLMTQFDHFGLWRKDIETSLTHWSPDVFRIFGWPWREGPVDSREVIEMYHPEDRALVLDCISEAVSRKTGFWFVLRLRMPDGSWKFIQSNARYRVSEEGREELVGTVCEIKERVRSATVYP